MSVLHPFSASSKPIQDWDSLPSRPLRFAATLRRTSIEADSEHETPRIVIPRPRRQVLVDSDVDVMSTPVAVRTRNDWGVPPRIGLGESPVLGSPSASMAPVGSDEWMQTRVAHCVDNAESVLDLSDYGLEQVSTKISDLKHLVTLPNTRSPTASPRARLNGRFSPPPPPLLEATQGRRAVSLGERTFARTQSAPASATLFAPASRPNRLDRGLGALLPSANIVNGRVDYDSSRGDQVTLNQEGRRRLERSKTGIVHFTRSVNPEVVVNLSRNRLRSALFEIQYLTALFLRNNELCSLPAAIGELIHLKELNISNNKIEYLPSTILSLSRLEIFHAHPNRWRRRPAQDGNPESTVSRFEGRVLSPTRLLGRQLSADASATEPLANVPRLTDLCLTVLLSPRVPSHLPPLLDHYDWDSCHRQGTHPLLDPQVLVSHVPVPSLRPRFGDMLQCLKSAHLAQAMKRRGQTDLFPRSHMIPAADDASTNPYYHSCPSPRHLEWDVRSSPPPQLERRVFLDPAEERFEWIDICGETDIPIQWLGCSPGCLAYLDQDDDFFDLDELDLEGAD